MADSTGVRKRRTPEDRINDAIDGVGDAYLRKARRYSDKAFSQGGALGTGPIYGSINPGTNSLQTSGGTMIGSIAFNPLPLGVIDGRINIEPGQSGTSKASSYVLAAGTGSPDELRFIDGADKNGQYLILQATETQILILRAAALPPITSISGVGTVTVDTSFSHNLSTGDKVNILGTDNFNINNVEVTVTTPTQLTYSATGNILSESGGLVQDGNIVTPDGNDVILNATVSPNGIPVASLIFDPFVEGFGAWRIVSVSITTGGTSVSGSVAALAFTSSSAPTLGRAEFDDNIFFGSGISATATPGVFKLSGSIFQLNSSMFIQGVDTELGSIWQSSSSEGGSFTNIGIAGSSISLDNTTLDDFSESPITNAVVDARTADVFVQVFTVGQNNPSIQSTVGTWGKIFSIGGGGGDLSFPILYPQDNFGDQGAVTLNIDISGNTGQNKAIRMVGDVGFQFTSLPGTAVLEEIWITFEQDGTGNHSIGTTPTGLKNASNLNTLLDKTTNAKTTFHFITEDGGATFRADLVDLVTAGAGVQFPIRFPVTIGLPTTGNVILNLNQTSGQYFTIGPLTGDIDITITNPPTANTAQAFRINIIKGATDFTVTFNDTLLVEPFIGIENTTTLLAGDIYDGAVFNIFTMTSTAGSGAPVEQWATFPAVSDINFATFDGINIDRLRFISDEAVAADPNDPTIFLDGVSNMVFNLADQKQFFWSMGSKPRMALDQSGVNNDTTLTVETDDSFSTSIPFINIFRDDPTPQTGQGVNSEIALLQFIGTNAATDGGVKVGNNVYSQLVTIYESVITGREAASLNFFTAFDTGTETQLKPFLGLNNVNSNEIDAFVDVNLNEKNIRNVADIKGIDDDVLQFQIIFDADENSDTSISNQNGVLDRINVFAGGINGTFFFFNTANSEYQMGIPNGVAAYWSLGDHRLEFDATGIPSEGVIGNDSGVVFLDTSTDPPILKIRKKTTGGTVSIVSLEAGGGVTNEISQDDSSIVITDPGGAGGVINYQVDNTTVGNVTILGGWIFDNTGLTISSPSGFLLFQSGFKIDNVSATSTEFQIPNNEELKITENNADRIVVDTNVTLACANASSIFFKEAAGIVGKYDGSANEWQFNQNVRLTGAAKINSQDATEIGYFVTNFAGNPGAAGSNQIPVVASLSPSLGNLDDAFGSAVGCMGVFNTSAAFVNVAWKTRSDEWIVIAIPSGNNTVLGEHIN